MNIESKLNNMTLVREMDADLHKQTYDTFSKLSDVIKEGFNKHKDKLKELLEKLNNGQDVQYHKIIKILNLFKESFFMDKFLGHKVIENNYKKALDQITFKVGFLVNESHKCFQNDDYEKLAVHFINLFDLQILEEKNNKEIKEIF